ncbi:hypothetical protein PMAYCL1PPCAC_32575 [Pristionchus mayeri]|uniref:t-SNARE coiled-coil homology domain-containing protein n=1 Tax=Pristionchus mayeri TaxID=1317129 RepID=A0AAN5DHL1_9BILA|nr:hypothetical protein PMAYCL1PPCAC_32575 [Pristionchus mayeri]
MVKDRMGELAMVRQSRGRGKSADSDDECDPEKQKMLTAETWVGIEQFHEQVERFKADMERVEKEVDEIRVLHGRILSQPPTPALTNEMNRKSDDVQRTLRALKDEVIELDKEVKRRKGQEATAMNRMYCEQVKGLTKSLVRVTERFNIEQMDYREKSRRACIQYMRVRNMDLPDDVIDEAIQDGTLSEKLKGVILAVDEKKALLDDVKLRTDDILHLEKSMRELSEMFHDLHLLVVSQGELLENIERNVANSVEYSEKARGDIVAAQKLKRRAQIMKICMIIGIIVAVIILFMVGKMLFCFYLPFLCG